VAANFAVDDDAKSECIDLQLLSDLFARFGQFVPPSLDGPLGLSGGPVREYIDSKRRNHA
jgi:hypothetical protein